MKNFAQISLVLFFLTALANQLAAQNSNVALFFYTTSYSKGDSTLFMEKQSNTLKEDLMFSYGYRASSYSNYSKPNFINSIENECSTDSLKHLFIYIAGRNYKDETGSYILLNSSEESDPGSMISMSELTTIVSNCKAEHILTFVDVPGTGELKAKDFKMSKFKDSSPLTGNDLINNSRVIPARFIVASNADSVNMGGSKFYTVLSSKFLEALRNYGESDGVLTMEELSYYLNNVEPSPYIGAYKPVKGSDYLFISK